MTAPKISLVRDESSDTPLGDSCTFSAQVAGGSDTSPWGQLYLPLCPGLLWPSAAVAWGCGQWPVLSAQTKPQPTPKPTWPTPEPWPGAVQVTLQVTRPANDGTHTKEQVKHVQ